MYYQSLERDKITTLQLNRWDFDKKATLSPQVQEELSWWVNNETISHNVLTRGKPSYMLTTDASKEGWGAVFGTHSTGGLWATLESGNHIKYLKLLAVFRGCSVRHVTIRNCSEAERGTRVKMEHVV